MRTYVDAMNVIGSRPDGWWRDRDAAVRRLVARARARAAASGDQLVVVVDGRPLDDLPEGNHGGVEVRYATRRGPDAADDRLVELLADHVEAHGPGDVEVVTADRALRDRVAALGVAVVGPRAFLAAEGTS